VSGSAPLDWDYTEVADAYLARPGYAAAAIDALVDLAGVERGARVCDVGAGTGILTRDLAARGLAVVAVEPNAAMRRLGLRGSRAAHDAMWCAMRAEATGFRAASFDLVTFGSSFNVVTRDAALRETARILRPGGRVACLWNHRSLDDPLQRAIDQLIRRALPLYDHGSRRADPTAELLAGGLFREVRALAADVVHRLSRERFARAWESHLTLRRQAGDALQGVLDAIRRLLEAEAPPEVAVPYTTRVWVARRAAR